MKLVLPRNGSRHFHVRFLFFRGKGGRGEEETKTRRKREGKRKESTASPCSNKIAFLHKRYRGDCIDPCESRKWRILPTRCSNKIEADNPRESKRNNRYFSFFPLSLCLSLCTTGILEGVNSRPKEFVKEDDFEKIRRDNFFLIFVCIVDA